MSSVDVQSKEYVYDAFASYATDPDAELVRALESIVEGFHRREGLPQEMRYEIELCVDGRDFAFPRRVRGRDEFGSIFEIVVGYMRKSRALLVLTGPLSKNHPWINKEVEWWLANRPTDPIYFCLTHGASPNPTESYPPALKDRGWDDLPISFDLRKFHSSGSWRKLVPLFWSSERTIELRKSLAVGWQSVRPFEEESARVAARLLADKLSGQISLDAVEAAWQQQEIRNRRKRRVWRSVGAATAMIAGLVLWRANEEVGEAEKRATSQSWLRQARALSDRGGAALPDALAYAGSALFTQPDAESTAVAVTAMQSLVRIEKTFKLDGGDPTWTAETLEDEEVALVGGRSGILRALDLKDGKVLWRADLRSSAIRTIVFDRTSSTIVVGTDRGVLKLRWSGRDQTEGPTEVARALQGSRIGGLAIDPQRKKVIVGLLSTGQLLSFPMEADMPWVGEAVARIMDPRFLEDGTSDVPSGIYGMKLKSDRLVVVGIDGVVSLLSAGSLERPPKQFLHPQAVFAMTVSSDGRELILADEYGGVSIYDLETTKLARSTRGAPTSASVARSLRGTFAVGVADRFANVGLALDPRDGILAVTSHDRTVRFLSYTDLAPLGTAAHGAATRAVAFVGSSGRALTFSDDGFVQLVQAVSHPELARIADVGGFAVGGSDLVAWPMRQPGKAGYSDAKKEKKAVEIYSIPWQGLEPTSIGAVAESPGSGLVVAPDRVALRPMASTRVDLLGLPKHSLDCTFLQQSNTEFAVDVVRQLSPGPEVGTLATLVERHNAPSKARFLSIWKVDDCTVVKNWETVGPFAVAANTIVTMPNAGNLEVRAPITAEPRTLNFDREISNVSVSDDASLVLVTLQNPPSVCVCSKTRFPRGRRVSSCAAKSQSYFCRPAQQSEQLESAQLSASGKYSLAKAKSGAQMLAKKSTGWRYEEVAPAPTRPLPAPFALDPKEERLAIPAGPTGVSILDPADGHRLLEFPTPNQVTDLSFLGSDRLTTLDGNVLRVWDLSQTSLQRSLCQRWNAELPIERYPGIPPAMARHTICGQNDQRAR